MAGKIGPVMKREENIVSEEKHTISGRVLAAIFAVALLSFMGIMTETAMNVTYPELSRQFNISLDTTQWITAGYLLMVTIVMGTTAYLLKKVAAKKLQAFAVCAFIIGDLTCAMATSFPVLMVGRLVQAMATGLATPTMFHLIFTEVPREKLGEMTGLAAMVISLAPALGPTYGGLISTNMSWQMIFWLILPFALVSLIMGQIFIDSEPVQASAEPFSYVSFISLALAMFVWIEALSLIGKYGFVGRFWLMLVAAIVLFALFVYLNIHGKSQLVDLSIFRFPAVSLDGLTYFNLQFMNIGISLVIPVYAQYVLQANAFIAGLILLPGTIVGAVVSPLAGHIADRHGFRLPVMIGNTLLVLGALLFWACQDILTPMLLMLFFLVLRTGFNFTFSNTISNASVQVPMQNTADVSSIFNMIQQFAGATGVVFLASLMAIFQNRGTGSMAQRTYTGGRVDFIIMVVLAVLTFVICLSNYRRQARQAKKN